MELKRGNIRIQVPDEMVKAAEKEVQLQKEREAHWATHADLDPEGWVHNPGQHAVKGKRYAEPWRGTGAKPSEDTRVYYAARKVNGVTVQPNLSMEEALEMVSKAQGDRNR